MKYETLYDGTQIPRLGIGTWRMGGGMSADYSTDQEVVEILRLSLEAGYTHIDTAEMYGAGHTEELIAQAIKGFERNNLFITSKVWQTNLKREQVLHAIEGSLRRLNVDYLDMALIHWPSKSIPLQDSLDGLNQAAKRGLTRYIGVSNFDQKLLRQALEQSERPIATNQVPYSLADREAAHSGVLEYCQENDIVLTAYSPIDRGSVISKPAVRSVAEKHRATPVQVALAWLITQPKVIAIPKAARAGHMRENLASLDLVLDQDDIKLLDSSS